MTIDSPLPRSLSTSSPSIADIQLIMSNLSDIIHVEQVEIVPAQQQNVPPPPPNEEENNKSDSLSSLRSPFGSITSAMGLEVRDNSAATQIEVAETPSPLHLPITAPAQPTPRTAFNPQTSVHSEPLVNQSPIASNPRLTQQAGMTAFRQADCNVDNLLAASNVVDTRFGGVRAIDVPPPPVLDSSARSRPVTSEPMPMDELTSKPLFL